MDILVPISVGELLDKITILTIKCERLQDSNQLANVENELKLLEKARDMCLSSTDTVEHLSKQLKAVNVSLWEVENEIRNCERNSDFGERFVELARSVYRYNDHRSAIKREINLALGSTIVDEKSYTDYD